MPANSRSWLKGRWLDIGWAAFAAANLVVMAMVRAWETVPFHFIWVSLTLLYGYRVWRRQTTAVVLCVVVVLTGLVLADDVVSGAQPIGELTEVPLMAAMFAAMVWHARRHQEKSLEVQRVLEVNRALLERERLFIQNASHELKTPITVALGHAELLRAEPPGAVAAEDLNVVTEELQRLRRLADRLLVLAGAEAPGFLAREQVALDVLVAEVFHRWSPAQRRWRLGVLDSATMLGDRDRLALAVDALVENAVAHTEVGADISLGVQLQGDCGVVAVADTGSGIAASELDRIFDRFARVESGSARGPKGTGLGLAIARAVAEAHGGTVRVRSTPGRGSVFELVLPVVHAEEPTSLSSRASLVPAEWAPLVEQRSN